MVSYVKQRTGTSVCYSQSLDASDDGVEGSLNVSSRAGGHDGLALFMEQLGHILHKKHMRGSEFSELLISIIIF